MVLKRTQFDLIEERGELFNKQVRRLWFIWIIGILIEAIGIKPSGFSAGGLSLTFQRPEIIQGVIYLVCLFQAFKAFVIRTSRSYRPYLDFRNIIWESLPRKQKTLRQFRSRKAAFKVKWMSRIILYPLFDLMAIMVPVGFILYYNSTKVTAALRAILTGAV